MLQLVENWMPANEIQGGIAVMNEHVAAEIEDHVGGVRFGVDHR